jgi:hypothetical protein
MRSFYSRRGIGEVCVNAWMRGCVNAWMRGCVDEALGGQAGNRGEPDFHTPTSKRITLFATRVNNDVPNLPLAAKYR